MTSPATHRTALLVALALAMPIAWQAPAHAQVAQSLSDPYADLYAAMDAVIGSDQEFNRQYGIMMQGLRQLPKFQQMERSDPGIVGSIGAAMRPWIKRYSERLDQRTKPRFMALMKRELTPDDAHKMAAYCRTQRGREFLLKQFDPERASSSGPRQPLGQPTAFLKPAEGHNPPKPKPAATPAADAPQDPAVTAILSDLALQARVTRFFAGIEEIQLELDEVEPDKDIMDGMLRDIDYAASTYGWRLFDAPLR